MAMAPDRAGCWRLRLRGYSVFIFALWSVYVHADARHVDRFPFATWAGLGPDKWASIWLAHRYLNPGVRVRIVPENSAPDAYLLFDTPGSLYRRDTRETTFEKLKQAYLPDAKALDKMVAIINDIEVNMWLPDENPLSPIVENAYRQMQQKYGRTRVPYNCYLQFFDNVENIVRQNVDVVGVALPEDSLMPQSSCGESVLSGLGDSKKLVPEIPANELFDLIRSGKKIVFVDVREPEEFTELHIPGAINMRIRDVNRESVGVLRGADLIVSYCVKDFRGFEMARKLRDHGFSNSVILNPYGLKGWIKAGLPVFEEDGIPEEQALTQLARCVDRDTRCQATL